MNDRLLRTSGDSRIKKYAAGILCAVLAVTPGLTGCGTSTVNSTSVSAAALQTADGDSSFYGQAMAMLEKGDYQNAYTYFQSAINSEGHAAEGRRGQGICQLKLGNYDDAITLFDQACSAVRYPSLNEAFLEDCELYEVQACIAAEQYDKALTLCDSLIRGDRSGEAFLLRGTVYLKTEKYGQAAADFQHAIEADPSYDIYLKIYQTYTESSRQADGAVFLKDALNIEPQSAEDNEKLGQICYELGDYDSAEKYLTVALEGGVADAVSLLGRTYLDAGDTDGARSMYQKCVDDGTFVAAGYNGLAICDMQDENYEAALEHITAGLSSGDTSMQEELLYNEIIVYEKQGDYETAASKMTSFLGWYPQNTAAVAESRFISSRVQQKNSTPQKVLDSGADTGDSSTDAGTTADTGSEDGSTDAGTTADTGSGDGSTDAGTTADTGSGDDSTDAGTAGNTYSAEQ